MAVNSLPTMSSYIPFSVLTLAFIFSAQSLPFAHEVDKHMNSGKLNDKTQEPGFSPRGSASSGCTCDQNGPPTQQLEVLKHELLYKPHPMFLLSEMAENLHQERYCSSKCQGILSPQTEMEIPGYVRDVILGYLNAYTIPSTEEHPCPPHFNITFYPKRYPRYLVEVVCGEPTNGNTRTCSYCSLDSKSSSRKVKSGRCYTYHLANMPYLTQDPIDHGCAVTDEEQIWHHCILPDVGVGCRCAS